MLRDYESAWRRMLLASERLRASLNPRTEILIGSPSGATFVTLSNVSSTIPIARSLFLSWQFAQSIPDTVPCSPSRRVSSVRSPFSNSRFCLSLDKVKWSFQTLSFSEFYALCLFSKLLTANAVRHLPTNWKLQITGHLIYWLDNSNKNFICHGVGPAMEYLLGMPNKRTQKKTVESDS